MERMLMKPIQLCGIGNGLVDMQYQITNETFEKLNLPKGEMRLVSTHKQNSLIAQLKDVLPHKSSGGSATNTIYAFAKFGGKAGYLTTVGDDGNGRFYYDELDKCNIAYKENVIRNTNTGTCLVLITPDGERTMLTDLAASSQFRKEHLDEDLISKSEWLYLEGYKFSEEDGKSSIFSALDMAKRHNTKIALTASDVFIVQTFNKEVREVLSQSDLFFCNEAESMALTYENNSFAAFTEIQKICSNVVMTKGANGAIVAYCGDIATFDAVPTNAIDTTGAGDSFAAGFLYGIIKKNNLHYAGRLASKLASLVVSKIGARYTDNYDIILNTIQQ